MANELFLTKDFVQSHVSRVDRADLHQRFSVSFLRPELFSSLESPEILDIGCGGGHALDLFETMARPIRYTGLDFSPGMIETAAKRYPGQRFVRFEFKDSLPFDDGSFDLVYFYDVLEHVEHPRLLIDEAIRVSRRHVLCTARCSKLADDLLLMKVKSDVRINVISIHGALAQLSGPRVGSGLRVAVAVDCHQPYDPTRFTAPADPAFVEHLDAVGGARKIHLLMEKTGTGRFEIRDETREPRFMCYVLPCPAHRKAWRLVRLGLQPRSWVVLLKAAASGRLGTLGWR